MRIDQPKVSRERPKKVGCLKNLLLFEYVNPVFRRTSGRRAPVALRPDTRWPDPVAPPRQPPRQRQEIESRLSYNWDYPSILSFPFLIAEPLISPLMSAPHCRTNHSAVTVCFEDTGWLGATPYLRSLALPHQHPPEVMADSMF